eukprot:1159404-Pelagomonas_calceolata.AAC.5
MRTLPTSMQEKDTHGSTCLSGAAMKRGLRASNVPSSVVKLHVLVDVLVCLHQIVTDPLRYALMFSRRIYATPFISALIKPTHPSEKLLQQMLHRGLRGVTAAHRDTSLAVFEFTVMQYLASNDTHSFAEAPGSSRQAK